MAVLRTVRALVAEYHFGVLCEIAVDGEAVFILTEVYPIRLYGNGPITLLKKDNVRYNVRSGVSAESVVGKSDRAEEIRPLCQMFARAAVFGIHGIAGGNKGHHAARTHLI